MRLTRVYVENFRGIRRLDLSLDAVTVLIGENNHGKTSVFDVLGLCLGRRGASPDSRFRQDDFYRHPNGDVGSIRIVLTFGDEDDSRAGPASGDAFARAMSRDRDGSDLMRAEFFGAPEEGHVNRRFIDEDGGALEPQPDSSMLERLQRLHPVLLLRFAQPHHEPPPTAEPSEEPRHVERRGARNLEALIGRVYHDLSHTRGPLPTGEIASALRAARRLYGRADDSADIPMHRMLNELLTPRQGGPQQAVPSVSVRAGSGSQTVGLLLVVGAMLEVRGDEALPEHARPIIAIEEPEAHLHPILLASTWDVIEALSAQTVVTTNSGELLGSVPMKSLRRLVRGDHQIDAYRLRGGSLTETELRRVSYHVRAKRGGVLFSRCWLLVEGESEFWLLSQLAHVLGYDLEAEGVRCVEFAQCGVTPLVKLANDLGIEWHMLADGDESGAVYVRDAEKHLGGQPLPRRVSLLGHRDVERCLWYHGFEHVYREAARVVEGRDKRGRRLPPGRVIAKAVRRKSKPYLALMVAEECATRGPDSVPPLLRNVIESSVALAREAVSDGARGSGGVRPLG